MRLEQIGVENLPDELRDERRARRHLQPAGGDNAYAVLIADTAWHHFELRNIDWTARTFDIYVDGTLSASEAFPTIFGNSVGSVDFFNTATSSTTYWDEIDVTP